MINIDLELECVRTYLPSNRVALFIVENGKIYITADIGANIDFITKKVTKAVESGEVEGEMFRRYK